MPELDLPLAELRDYRPQIEAPADFEEFWTRGIAAARAAGREPTLTRVDTGFSTITTYDVSFPGHGGDPIRGWLHRPAGLVDATPAVVTYAGYGGGRLLPHEDVFWANAGYAHFAMDTRGQGAGWGWGDTEDTHGSGPSHPGFMTRGITDPEGYYYRRLMIDAVRAVDAAAVLPGVDPTRIAVAGASQGGGLALAAAGLHPAVTAALVDVPFLCHFARGIRIAPEGPFVEITNFLKVRRDAEARVLETLRYFDGVSLAARAGAPALFSVALMDPICPPSTVFAAYNAYPGEKSIEVYPYNEHEGGGTYHRGRQLRWLAERFQR